MGIKSLAVSDREFGAADRPDKGPHHVTMGDVFDLFPLAEFNFDPKVHAISPLARRCR